jgi:rhodanese-related sulfurtransferase
MSLSHRNSALTGFLLDMREPMELAGEKLPEVINIPLGQLRGGFNEFPRDRKIHVICRSGSAPILRHGSFCRMDSKLKK